MAELTHDEQDELTKAILDRDHDCAHNMVPLIRAVEEIVDARVAAAFEQAAEVVEEGGSDLWWWTLAEEIRALAKRECSPTCAPHLVQFCSPECEAEAQGGGG